MLDTVGDYISEARVIMQDVLAPQRSSDAEIKSALGMGILEMRRLRPELFVFDTMPDINSATVNGTAVDVEPQFRVPLLYFVVGQVTLKDEEEGGESRAAGFTGSFRAKLLTVGA